MPLEDAEAAYLWDMLSAAHETQEILGTLSLEEFKLDTKVMRAIERCIEIVGEAARRVSKETQQFYDEVPWSDIIGQRNVIAHKYGQIDYEVLYKTVTGDLPQLVGILERLLEKNRPETP
jgi:uncharacterized protein with HEPN domain